MSTPVLLGIVQSLQTALQGIAQAAGYFTTIKNTSVVLDPVALDTVPATETPFLVIGHRVEPVSRDFKGSRPTAIQERWRFVLEAALDAPGSDTARKLTASAQFAADVEVACVQDPQRGALALYTYVMQPTTYTGLANQNRLYVEVPIEVLVQRQYGVP